MTLHTKYERPLLSSFRNEVFPYMSLCKTVRKTQCRICIGKVNGAQNLGQGHRVIVHA